MRRVVRIEAPVSLYRERRFDIEVPKGTIILSIVPEHNAIWCEVENVVDIEQRSFKLYVEDEPIALGFRYVKTILGRTRETTTHLYEKTH